MFHILRLLGFAALISYSGFPVSGEERVGEIALVSGKIADGTGAPIRDGDVLIADGEIVLPSAGDTIKADWTIDCSGLVICPRFH